MAMTTVPGTEDNPFAAPEAPVGQPQPHTPPPDRLRPLPIGHPVIGWLAPIAVTLFAFALRLHRLSIPGKMAFDEVYYGCDAWSLLKFGYERSHGDPCTTFTDGPAFIVHPPLGKWLIAAGEAVYGFTPLGWRISAAIAGALSVLILCRLGRRMFRSTALGCMAGFLLALDGLHFVQSRTSMLDIFLLLFVLAAAACLVADRDDGRRRLAAKLSGDMNYPGPKLGFRWWRLATGLCLGAALATKWSAAVYVVAFLALAFAWDVGARRTAGVPAPFRAAIWREALPLLTLLVVVPSLVYVASWSGWFVTDGGWRRTCTTQFPTDCGVIAGWWKYHQEMWNFHATLTTAHPYESKPWGWLLLARPVSYFYSAPVEGTAKEVLAIGTPAIWWASVFALGATAFRWLSRRDWRATLILVGFGAGFLPWFRDLDRTMFLFYALPSVPFMCLALTFCAGWALGGRRVPEGRRTVAASAIGAYLLVVAINFFFFYPVLAAKVIPYPHWQNRIWFNSWI